MNQVDEDAEDEDRDAAPQQKSEKGLAAYVAFTGSSPETPTCRQVTAFDPTDFSPTTTFINNYGTRFERSKLYEVCRLQKCVTTSNI